jgi:hypothetical protein
MVSVLRSVDSSWVLVRVVSGGHVTLSLSLPLSLSPSPSLRMYMHCYCHLFPTLFLLPFHPLISLVPLCPSNGKKLRGRREEAAGREALGEGEAGEVLTGAMGRCTSAEELQVWCRDAASRAFFTECSKCACVDRRHHAMQNSVIQVIESVKSRPGPHRSHRHHRHLPRMQMHARMAAPMTLMCTCVCVSG